MTHQSSFIPQKVQGARCCSAAPGNGNGSKTPQLLKVAVSGSLTCSGSSFSARTDTHFSLSPVWMISGDEAMKMGIVEAAHDNQDEVSKASVRLGEELSKRNWKGKVYAEIRKGLYPEFVKAGSNL
ncbi:hypothetical protein SLEP1_g33140 [Rubroshorea leprosula]|uniref:Uncharacterized protein n=1 Tax=Rubroshorea leprosula TaxID=152421 RepID=A0AAV5KFS9_9ROSI|nr:hypothetical protein SLEP1_g33140 [Rubroshorea leprosula]